MGRLRHVLKLCRMAARLRAQWAPEPLPEGTRFSARTLVVLVLPGAALPARPAWCDEVLDATANSKTRPSGSLQGIGVSHGRHRGRARVVTDSYTLPGLKPGDILVASNVGPMWTPLFPLLGGLVLEHGAMGQHAAATARAYSIPAVIHIQDACRRTPDGSWIT